MDLDVLKGIVFPAAPVKSLANKLFKPVHDFLNFSCKHEISHLYDCL
jgi:hypothetical protein